MRPRPFRGTVEAAAYLFDEAVLGPAEVMRRVLALWDRGASLRRTRVGLVLALAQSRRIAVEAAPGLPLVSRRGVLLGFPAADEALARLAAPAGALVLAHAGQVLVVADGQEVSPAAWLDLGQVKVVATQSLAAPTAPSLRAPRLATVHEALGPAVPPPSEAREEIMREAAAGAGGTDQGNGGVQGSGHGQAAGGWFDRFVDRMGHLLGIHRLLGRKHGRYLADLMAMLEGGEVREGLRHAIPLESARALARPRRGGLPWWRPRPRESLTISPTHTPAGTTLTLEPDLFTRLRAVYRQTFERLDAQGRREEAAFVLAELLQQDEEAVAYLEKHGELRRAAELAESRRCAAGLVVRAWFLAGDRARALRIARERGAFADAIVRLQAEHPNEARALRLLWADALATAGDYAGAVRAVERLPQGRGLLRRWIEAGLALGERQTGHLLALAAALLPDRWPETMATAADWMTGGEAPHHRRRTLAEALLTVTATPEVRSLARRCLRASLPAPDGTPLDSALLRQLVRLTGDAALEVDLPPAVYSGHRWPVAGSFVQATLEAGTEAWRDLVVLPSGRLLVAEGEAGVALLSPGGTPLHRFDVPAERLVISDAGDRAIALAQRGDSFQLARLDLANRRARPWGLVRLHQFAESYDGNAWFVSEYSRVLALDALDESPRCTWSVSVDEEVGLPQALVRNPTHLMVLVSGWGFERWDYRLPALTLEARRPVEWPSLILGAVPMQDGVVFGVTIDVESKELVLISAGTIRREVRFALSDGAITSQAVAATNGFRAVTLSGPIGLKVRLLDPALTVVAEIDLPGAEGATVRFCDRYLVMVRHDGGALTLDLERGTTRTLG